MKAKDILPTWGSLLDLAAGNAAAHRATGIGKAEHRRDTAPTPLPRYIDVAVAWDGVADELLKLPPAALRYAPTAATRRRVVRAAIHRQWQVERSPGRAVTGSRRGEGFTAYGADVPEAVAEYCPLEDMEVREAVATVMANLPAVHRDTAARLLDGAGAPDGVKPSTWRTRVAAMREAFRAAWQASTATALPAGW